MEVCEKQDETKIPVAEKIILLSDNDGGKETGKKRSSTDSFGEDYNRIKRRKLHVAGAPKMPLTGYVRYMNERREELRRDFPNKTAMEHTKIIGEEWQQLSEERKMPYMKAAEEDKIRYDMEINKFFKQHPDILERERERARAKVVSKNKQDTKNVLKEKPELNGNNTGKAGFKEIARSKENSGVHFKTEHQSKRAASYDSQQSIPNITSLPGEIPIFTNEFMEHNKIFDMELRTLRKSKTDLEQQNAVLEKHVENMKFGVEKLSNENEELQKKNRLLEIFLVKLKRKLATALSGLAIPNHHGATVENIEKYMADLHKLATSNTHGPASLNKAKDIIRKLDLEIQF